MMSKVIQLGTVADFGHGLLRCGLKDAGERMTTRIENPSWALRCPSCARLGATGTVQAWARCNMAFHSCLVSCRFLLVLRQARGMRTP